MNDYRYNPFENVSTAVTITGEKHVIPSVSPYTVRLDEVPMKETPSSISLTIAGSAGAEVSAAPAAGEFWPDYSTGADGDDGWNTGTILFNGADAGKTVVVSYVGTGTIVDTRTSHGQAIFKESGVWICPEGITKVFISMCGGGGGGGATTSGGGVGTNGNAGGRSSFGALLLTNGGGGGAGTRSSGEGAGGSSGGTGGTSGDAGVNVGTALPISGRGGSCLLGIGGPPRIQTGAGYPGCGFGAGGSGGAYVASAACGASGGGGGAHSYLRQEVAVAPGTEYTITIGAGGVGGDSSFDGGNGAPGICIIEW